MSAHVIVQLKFIRCAFRKFRNRLLARRLADQAPDHKIEAIAGQKDQAPDEKIKAIDAWSLTQAPH
jgi:hypothetical protein